MSKPNNKEQTNLAAAQLAYKKGFVNQWIAKGASVEEATKHADAAIASMKKARARREKIRDAILSNRESD